MEQVIAYVDGYNLYYSLRDQNWKWAYWLNIPLLIQNVLTPNQTLKATKYFTTRVSLPEDKRQRQLAYLEALETLPNIQFFYGKYIPDEMRCRKCGHTYTTYHEKMTDVNIAVEMLTDTLQNNLDTALLVSGDSDLVGLIRKVKELTQKRVIVLFPVGRKPRTLRDIASASLDMDAALLRKSLLPEQVAKANGYVLKRPTQWQ